MTKSELMEQFREYIAIKRRMLEFDERTGGLFCITENEEEIHISGYGEKFSEICAVLQPTVHHEPNWYSDTGIMYFHIDIDGKPVKVFGLWHKGIEK